MILAYTFRTYPNLEQIHQQIDPLFVFGSLKADFEVLSKQIVELQPDSIVGFAFAKVARYESIAINQFHKTRKIMAGGPSSYPLFVPPTDVFVSKKPTDSFCNWTMYRLSHLFAEHHLKTRLTFLHGPSTEVIRTIEQFEKSISKKISISRNS